MDWQADAATSNFHVYVGFSDMSKKHYWTWASDKIARSAAQDSYLKKSCHSYIKNILDIILKIDIWIHQEKRLYVINKME